MTGTVTTMKVNFRGMRGGVAYLHVDLSWIGWAR